MSEIFAAATSRQGASALALLPKVHLLGARLHAITEQECVRLVLAELEDGRGGWVVTMNLELLRQFVQDESCAACYMAASVVIADGMPLIWASRLQRTPLPERVTGSNLIWSLSAAAAARGRSIFLLGGKPRTAHETARILSGHYPSLRIAGIESPEPGFEKKPAEMERLVAELLRAQPDIIFVALGSPKQEELIRQLHATLPQAWWVGVGISFSFVSGEIPRAPIWMQRVGLEWLHRLLHEPRRLARRYLLQGIPFAFTLFGSALRRRFDARV